VNTLARVVEERREHVAIAAVEGEVDASNVVDVAERVHLMLTNRSEVLVIDLTKTTYLDSAGINMLFTLGTELQERQQGLKLIVPPSSPIARMLSITGLDTEVPTFATRAEALA
jgi:anti-sigma B factor antagonist